MHGCFQNHIIIIRPEQRSFHNCGAQMGFLQLPAAPPRHGDPLAGGRSFCCVFVLLLRPGPRVACFFFSQLLLLWKKKKSGRFTCALVQTAGRRRPKVKVPENHDDCSPGQPGNLTFDFVFFSGAPSEKTGCLDSPLLQADATALVLSLSSSFSASPSITCRLANVRLFIYAGEARPGNVRNHFVERKSL